MLQLLHQHTIFYWILNKRSPYFLRFTGFVYPAPISFAKKTVCICVLCRLDYCSLWSPYQSTSNASEWGRSYCLQEKKNRLCSTCTLFAILRIYNKNITVFIFGTPPQDICVCYRNFPPNCLMSACVIVSLPPASGRRLSALSFFSGTNVCYKSHRTLKQSYIHLCFLPLTYPISWLPN